VTPPGRRDVSDDPEDVEYVIHRACLEMYHDNLAGARELLEDEHRVFPNPRYSAEDVSEVDDTVAAVVKLLRPGGRFCIVVPMNEFAAAGPLPEFTPDAACHVRAFREAELQGRFGHDPHFSVTKLPGEWRPGRNPNAIIRVESGSFFFALGTASLGPHLCREATGVRPRRLTVIVHLSREVFVCTVS
jgi:hypothetical protein